MSKMLQVMELTKPVISRVVKDSNNSKMVPWEIR